MSKAVFGRQEEEMKKKGGVGWVLEQVRYEKLSI